MSAWTIRRGDWEPGSECPPPEIENGPVVHLVADGERPANPLTRSSIDDLEAAIGKIATLEGVEAVVLSSAKAGHFIAGADIGEIAAIEDAAEATQLAERAQSVFGRLAGLRAPTFALIHGTCLGGGLELALACRYRVAVDDPATKIGLPEVNLGIIPGFGGSQRLPKLLGITRALPLILKGSRLPAAIAFRRGVVDALVPPEGALQVGLRAVRKIVGDDGRSLEARRRKLRGGWKGALLTGNPLGRALIRRAVRKQVLAETGGHYPAALAAIDLVTRFSPGPLEAGLAEEARVVGTLATSPVCKNLVSIFLASERARKLEGPEESAHGRWPRPGSLGVLGAGVMGAGVATAALERGLSVRLRDLAEEPLGRGLAQIGGAIQGAVRKRRRTALEAEEILSRLTHTTSLVGFGRYDAVLEAIVERMDVKQAALREIEPMLGEDALFLTNTSALSVTELQSAAAVPGRVVGLHFFNPVNRMPLVEVVAGERTDAWAVSRTIGLAQALGKFPVVVKDSPGFLVNRLLMPYLDAAVRMLSAGVPGPRIDAAARAFGLPMGPLRLIDEVGVDIGVEVAETLHRAFGARVTPSPLLATLAQRGWLGRKSGTGFYRHPDGKGRAVWNDRIADLLGAPRQELGDEEIQHRLVDPMVDEAARCLEEEIVTDAETVDLAMVLGTGFPPFRGGLLRYADTAGLAGVVERIAADESPREPCSLLRSLAAEGRVFHEEKVRTADAARS